MDKMRHQQNVRNTMTATDTATTTAKYSLNNYMDNNLLPQQQIYNLLTP